MAALPYVGKSQGAATDLVHRGYVTGLLSQNLTQATVDSQINTGLAPYVTRSYVDAQDALNATKAFIDAGDATRLKLTQRNAVGGVAGLDAQGRVDIARVAVPSAQRFPAPFFSPAVVNTAAVTVAGTEVQVFPTMTVADPGFAYKLFITGVLDASSNTDGEYVIIRVRQGSATGPIVAGGYGLGERYIGGLLTQYSPHGSYSYSIPSWANAVDVIALGGGAGGSAGTGFIIPINGSPGTPGAWTTVTLTRGSTLPGGTTSLAVTVGTAGGPGAAGTASSVTGTGVTTVTAAGGSGTGSGTPGTKVYNGNTYTGGAAQATLGGAGNAPGGGGGGGAGSALGGSPGGAGSDGAVWLFATPSPNIPGGPANIMPTPLNAQATLTGATTLYVMAVRSGTASTQTITTLLPKLMAIPFPA